MPIIKSAKKALKASENKRVFNLRRKKAIKDTIKEMRTLIKEGKVEEATKLLPKAQKALDKAAKTGLIKKNNASRRKSRLSQALTKKN